MIFSSFTKKRKKEKEKKRHYVAELNTLMKSHSPETNIN